MRLVDRGDFAKDDLYEDCPQYIGYGATISAPNIHAFALEQLEDVLKEGNKVLGWSTSVKVVGCWLKNHVIEHI